jgi:TerB-C domain
MLRDLWIGGALGIGFYWWRTQAQRVEITVKQSQSSTQQLQQQLEKAQRELTIAVTQRTALETQVAELNQIATDRAIDLIQLQGDNADLIAQIAELTQKRTRKKRTPNVTIPAEPADAPVPLSEPELASPIPFRLNLDLVQAKQLESVEATQLLQSVFIEEPATTPSAGTSLGLDFAHATFLQTLKQQTIWSRADLIRVAQQLNLLLDGALELINEAAFERCDEALTEGEDPLEVNPDVLQELLS